MAGPEGLATVQPDTRASVAGHPATDWVVRPFLVPGRSTAGLGLVLLLAFVAVSWGFRLGVQGVSPAEFARDPYTYLDVVNGLLFVYLAVSLHVLRLGRLRDLDALRPALAVDDHRFAGLVGSVVDVAPRRLLWSGLVGAILMGLMPVLDAGFWADRPPPLFSPQMIFFTLRSAAMGWLVGHVVATEDRGTRGFRRLGAEEVRVDLLDLGPLAPIARASFRSALAPGRVSVEHGARSERRASTPGRRSAGPTGPRQGSRRGSGSCTRGVGADEPRP